MLRAGPFSDERVVRLANRRFVPFYFDLSNRGFAGDPDARAFVVKRRPELGGRGVPTPPVLLMTPDGEVVGEVSNYASEDEVLRAMLAALKKRPEFDRPAPEEKAVTDPVARAEILLDLHDRKGALRALADAEGDRARYLEGHVFRLQGDWDAMEKALARVDDPDLADDVRMERAYRLWHAGDFAALRRRLQGFAKESNRYSEARYFEGLALFHLDRREAALATWRATIEACPEDPWVYRADWAFCGAQAEPGRASFSARGPRTSCLNRIGYMGRRNPDLAGPR